MGLYVCCSVGRFHGFLHRYRILYCFSSFLQDDDTGCRQDAAACRTQEEARNQIIKNDDSTRSGGIFNNYYSDRRTSPFT